MDCLCRVSFQKSKEDIESVGLSITRMLLPPAQQGRRSEGGTCVGLSDLGLGKEYAEKARLITCWGSKPKKMTKMKAHSGKVSIPSFKLTYGAATLMNCLLFFFCIFCIFCTIMTYRKSNLQMHMNSRPMQSLMRETKYCRGPRAWDAPVTLRQ